MARLQIFHMNKGEGEASYANNCTIQNKIQSITEKVVAETIQSYFEKEGLPETITVADLGCSSGPTALAMAEWVTDAIILAEARLKQLHIESTCPNIMVYLNDLHGNDFNKVFASLLPDFKLRLKKEKGGDHFDNKCFIAGCPGSFYGRLFPTRCLHFVHSSSSLHWLSQVPIELEANEKGDGKREERVNKGKIYISKGSPMWVIKAYVKQFGKDFGIFLRSRSEEVIPGGRMVLTLMCRKSIDPTLDDSTLPWDLLAQSLLALVEQGLIEEEKVDNFNVPFYAPSVEEVRTLIEKEASFSIYRFGVFELEWDGGETQDQPNGLAHLCNDRPKTIGDKISKIHRAVVEPMFQHHFGPHVMDQLFLHYGNNVDYHFSKYPSKFFNIVISLIRN